MRTNGNPHDNNLQFTHDNELTLHSHNKPGVSLLKNAMIADEPWFSSLIDQVPEFIYVKDTDGRFLFANESLLSDTDTMGNIEWKHGMTDFDYLPEASARKLREDDLAVMQSGQPLRDIEEQIVLQNKTVHWYSTTKAPLRGENGEIIGIVGISRDITARKRQDALNLDYANLLEMIVRAQPLDNILEALVLMIESQIDNMSGSILLYDAESNALYHGAAPGLPENYVKMIDGIGIGPEVGSCGTAAYRRQMVIVENIETDTLWANYYPLALQHDLRACWSTPIFGAGGTLMGTFALYARTPRAPTAQDMHLIGMATNLAGIAIDRHRSDEQVRFMAHHDPLTGLSNRNLFWSQLNRSLHEARRENRMVTIAYIDLDNFKQINDNLGHSSGDQVLRTVASRISERIRASDIAARLGGDEFAIVFSNPVHDEDGIVRRLEDIRQAIAMPVTLQDDRESLPTCSIGVAFFPRDGETPEVLLASADASMYAAKNSGRNRLHTSQ